MTVRLEQGHCRLQVWDNGVGFDLEAQEGGLDLQSIRKRVNALNGAYRVETSHDGTAVEVDFPLTKRTEIRSVLLLLSYRFTGGIYKPFCIA